MYVDHICEVPNRPHRGDHWRCECGQRWEYNRHTDTWRMIGDG